MEKFISKTKNRYENIVNKDTSTKNIFIPSSNKHFSWHDKITGRKVIFDGSVINHG